MMNDKAPPQDLNVEACTLGSMILDGIDQNVIHDILQKVNEQDFYREDHKIIFATIQSMIQEGKRLDIVLLKDELTRRGEFEKAGGVDYLMTLVEGVPSAVNGLYYAGIVKEHARKRQIIAFANDTLGRAYDPTIKADQIAGFVKNNADLFAQDVFGEINSICLNDVESKPIRWLWPNRFALGKLSLIAGDPGLGKSFITLDMTARVSQGAEWADNSGNAPKGSVLLLSAEDDAADTIRPRLDRVYADCSKIRLLQTIKSNGSERMPSLADDIYRLRTEIEHMKDCRLVIIDPVSAYLGQDADGHNNSDVRGLLAPLAALASEYDVAVVCVSHLNKSGGSNPLYRVTGSLAFTAAARTVYVVSRDNTANDKENRVFLPAKNNIGQDTDGLSYKLVSNAIAWGSEPIKLSAAKFFEKQEFQTHKTPARDDAKKWLINVLKDGPVWACDIQHMSREESINKNTLTAAKNELGVVIEREGFGKKSKVFWRFAEHVGRRPEYEDEIAQAQIHN